MLYKNSNDKYEKHPDHNSLGVRFYIGSILCTELHRAVFGYVVGLTLYRGLCPDAWNDPNLTFL